MKLMNKLRSVPAMMISITVISFIISKIIGTIFLPIFPIGIVFLMVFLWAGGFGWFMGRNYPTRPKRNVEEPVSVLDQLLGIGGEL